MNDIKKHIDLLGHKVKDKVTGITGTVETISFDLYGCIQADLHVGIDKDGKRIPSPWLDVTRLKILSKQRVMSLPNYSKGYVAEGRKGPSIKSPKA